MLVLIDGYNLLYAAGLAAPKVAPGRLKVARRRLLDWLADAPPRGAVLRVVFDAKAAPADSAEADHRGVRVRFAYQQTADDLIENMIAAETQPGNLVVVSNDSRLHEAARRRGCRAWSCQYFMDWLAEADRRTPPSPLAAERFRPLSADETAELLRVFEQERPRK